MRPVRSAVDHRICLECAYPVKDLPRCPECGQDVDAVTLRVWNVRRDLLEHRTRRLRRALGVLFGAVVLCGLGMYALCTAPVWGIGRMAGALTDHWVANVVGALVMPTIAILGAWLAPLPLMYFAKPHNRLPIACIWESSMWRFHVPWMSICVLGPLFGAIAAFPVTVVQVLGALLFGLVWIAASVTMAILWVQSVKRRLYEASLLQAAPGVWLVLWGVPMFLGAGILGFFAGMFTAVRSMEMWGTPGLV
ncbi:MAG TPA: hypothetical protein VHN77_04380 [Phycisphaerales bacterium]|nr:hypothetical protein [Phycisphaerales bacterium]